MPLVLLSDDDLTRAAQAARAMAQLHERHAEDDGHASIRQHFADQARRYRALATHLEQARQPTHGA